MYVEENDIFHVNLKTVWYGDVSWTPKSEQY